MDAKKVALWVVTIALIWPLQYLLWLPLVLLGRLIRFAFMIGFVGIVLLFIPIIGWIILFFMLMGRRNEKRFERLLKAMGDERKTVWHPWMIERLRSEPAKSPNRSTSSPS